jgi:hypothetical protein
MTENILDRKAKYDRLEVSSFDDKLDEILERRWTFGTCVAVFFASAIGVAIMLFVGNIVLGLN